MTTPTLIRKSFGAITKVVDEAQGLVEAIVNTTGVVDLQNDVMEAGCWDALCKSMAQGEADYPSILWGHDWAIPVGKVVHAEELYPGDARLKAFKSKGIGGLRIVGEYNLSTQRGREAYSDVSKGIIKQWSVGFMPADDGHDFDSKGVHHISKVGAWPEVSNVLVGASPGTHTSMTKSAEDVLIDVELSNEEKFLAIEQIILSALAEQAPAPEPEPEPIQPQAEMTAEAQPTAQQLAEKLEELIFARLNPPPQHSDPEDSGEEGLTFWAMQNIRPNKLNKE